MSIKDDLVNGLFLSKFHDFMMGYHSLSVLARIASKDDTLRKDLARQIMAMTMESADLTGEFVELSLPAIHLLSTEDEVLEFVQTRIDDVLYPVNAILAELATREERDELISEFVDPIYDQLFAIIADRNGIQPTMDDSLN